MMILKEGLSRIFSEKSILILGFGREGRSSYGFLRKYFPNKELAIADQNISIEKDELFKNDTHLSFHLGEDYLQSAADYDLILKTPGISNMLLPKSISEEKISGQTDVFLQLFGKQCVGITGTKGKSTTTFLTYEILRKVSNNVLLCGNMGIPLFDVVDEINPQTVIVCEFSSHQLQNVKSAPHIGVLLNLFQEHLDHYNSYKEYQLSKYNIAKYQTADDFFVFNVDNEPINELIAEDCPKSKQIEYSLEKNVENGCSIQDGYICFKVGDSFEKVYALDSPRYLQGSHNVQNIMAAIAVCKLSGISNEKIEEGIASFKGLEHRMEYVGNVQDVLFYNDSISTIPEATIAAVNALKNVDTLILGGFDRGIDYKQLAVFLHTSAIRNLVFVGHAGARILDEMQSIQPLKQQYLIENDYTKIAAWCLSVTAPKMICLLSPAAASYDSFKNFEERGKMFKEFVLQTSK